MLSARMRPGMVSTPCHPSILLGLTLVTSNSGAAAG
jgi:hypothetical protein